MDFDQESETSVSSFDDGSDISDDTESDVEMNEESSVVENEDEELEWNWSEDFIPSTNFSSAEIKGHTAIPLTESIDPIDIFNKFFTTDIIDMIVTQTNVYGEKKSLAKGSPNNWQKVNENNIRCFLGVLIIMGLHRVPRLRDYWSRNKVFYTEMIANVMPRNEFYQLFSALHLNEAFDSEELSSLSPPDYLLSDLIVDSIIILDGAHDEPNFKKFIRSFYSSFSHITFNVECKEMVTSIASSTFSSTSTKQYLTVMEQIVMLNDKKD
ncbi:unnamed protein product [Didymodactylos carnosus]|uniref:PiggyBac transposable element-derived protein domain-containing protein n=1 Tax=Didymodactylos carnosus TaxID=1234261 RepID=A0A8S2D3G5_9BILA|nr:unnamed protein product [Didymodactylos carnosus]CAF3613467.1 unnamed protein product [Didymodactylos carnosus]